MQVALKDRKPYETHLLLCPEHSGNSVVVSGWRKMVSYVWFLMYFEFCTEKGTQMQPTKSHSPKWNHANTAHTRSIRSLRFFSICCGGRRLIKSKAQSSCWSLCERRHTVFKSFCQQKCRNPLLKSILAVSACSGYSKTIKAYTGPPDTSPGGKLLAVLW